MQFADTRSVALCVAAHREERDSCFVRSIMAQSQMAGKQATADRISKLLSMCRRLELDWVRV